MGIEGSSELDDLACVTKPKGSVRILIQMSDSKVLLLTVLEYIQKIDTFKCII